MKKLYEMAPSTKRSERLLSRAYGYGTFWSLADSLPHEAVVVDFGAGRSRFGHAIVGRRDDISWFNVDPRYTGSWAQRAQLDAPSGLQYIAGDILTPPFPKASCDVVYSSALLPHIAMSSPELALRAVHNMAGMLRDRGELAAAGFINDTRADSLQRAVSTTAEDYNADPDLVASHIVDVMTLPLPIKALQGARNIVGHYLGIDRID